MLLKIIFKQNLFSFFHTETPWTLYIIIGLLSCGYIGYLVVAFKKLYKLLVEFIIQRILGGIERRKRRNTEHPHEMGEVPGEYV